MDLVKKKGRAITNIIFFWVAVWLFYLFFFSYNSENTRYTIWFSTILIPITAIPSYLTANVLIPKYLNRKAYALFGIYSFTTFLFTSLCILLLLILNVAYIDYFKFEDLPLMGRNYAYLVILVYLVVALVSFENIWKQNAKIASQNATLQNLLLTEKLKAKEQELKYLKNQIHPHFLFNTLNTIYGLALKNDKETPAIILRLSGLLDYILYQTNKEKVPLRDEISHLEKYIDLEKIRFNDSLKVSFSKEIESQNVLIAPLLLLPFVENAFKHGSTEDGFLRVFIYISCIANAMEFRIKNTYTKPNLTESGIGLKNIKERLELSYPKNYDLQIITKDNWFEVNLKINLQIEYK